MENEIFSNEEEKWQYLSFLLKSSFADMDPETVCQELAEYISSTPDSETALKLRAMFEWVEQSDFGTERLTKILNTDGLVGVETDTEAKEFLLYLANQIYNGGT